jgi:GNAT superfamily N-acetyltransferase
VDEMMALQFSVDTGTREHHHLLERWTSWAAGRGTPCAVGKDRPLEAFAAGRLRVVRAAIGDTCVGISLVAHPADGPAVDAWRLQPARTIPAPECLLWVGLAICPSQRKTGLAGALVLQTLHMAATTGFPYVAAIFPVHDARACALLVRFGFVKVEAVGGHTGADGYSVYLRHTPTLFESASAAGVAC